MTPKQARELLAELRKRLEPAAAEAFLAAIQSISDAVDLKALTDLISAGRVEEAVQMVTQMRGVYFPFTDAIRAAYVQGGLFAASAVPPLRNPLNGNRFAFAFDGHHSRAVTWAQQHAARWITNIQEENRVAARAVIVEGLKTNRPPATVARDLVGTANPVTRKREGGVIGLTGPQTDTYLRAQADLLSGDPARIRRVKGLASRNKTFDAMLDRAIAGEKLTSAEVSKAMAGMKSKMLGKRGEIVARHETFSAMAAGQHEGWAQLAESGAVKPQDVTKTFQHNHNDPFRPTHLALSGATVQLNEPFVLSDGTKMQHDHDPAGGVENTIGCHCTTFYRLRKGRGNG